MLNFLYYFLAWPFILLGLAVKHIFWDFFWGYYWRQEQKQKNSTRYWMERAIGAEHRLRDAQYNSQRAHEELESKYRQIIRRKER